MATLEVPAIGYGIRYEFGIFRQQIGPKGQMESTDPWLARGNPWEVIRPEWSYPVEIGGQTVIGVAYDTPILGYGVHTANTLRLWSAQAPDSFDFASFNAGDYTRAVLHKVQSETLSKVLYPNDEMEQGKRLRLSQQIFFVSCSLQDMFRILKGQGMPVTEFHRKFAVQLNDTHPAIAVAELMRLLMDDHGVDWETAWNITTSTISYTNHTLLPEALEAWGLELFQQLLPRHTADHLRDQCPLPAHPAHPLPRPPRSAREALADRGRPAPQGAHGPPGGGGQPYGQRRGRTAQQAAEGEPVRRIRPGVAGALHQHHQRCHPAALAGGGQPAPGRPAERRHRHRLVQGPGPAGAARAPGQRRGLPATLAGVREQAKEQLAATIRQDTGVLVDPASLFDVQVKRIHEYKRQHMAALQVVERYLRLRAGEDLPPRTVIFGGKAAPGYAMAKLIIRLIVGMAEIINIDPAMDGRLRVVFLPNFSVKLGQKIYPAVDLSEQISTAGMEASGTGNMKMALNGALTIGTLDGANIEIRERVGDDNFFLFGHTAEELAAINHNGYHPMPWLENDPLAKEAIDLIGSGHFSEGDRDLFHPLLANLCSSDPFRVMADLGDYRRAQNEVDSAWRDGGRWSMMSVLNTARCGFFSSDRAIREYAERIWKVAPVPINACSVIPSPSP